MTEDQKLIVDRLCKTQCYSVQVGGRPLKYEDRETLKNEAWAVMASDASPYAKANALLHIIEAHYWRARESLDLMPSKIRRCVHGKRYSRGYELDLDVYTRHWLWANSDSVAIKGRGCDLPALLDQHFGYQPEENKFMPKGCTDYALLESRAGLA